MGLRAIASAHLSRILSDTGGIGESITYRDRNGAQVSIAGVWIDNPSDSRHMIGIGLEATVSGARLVISANDVPYFDQGCVIVRSSTNERWIVDQVDYITGVSYHLTMSKPTDANVREVRR